ncbi:MAG TPA: ABC transporter ATP-binding protein [Acidimicrobiales bacterium]
MLTVDNIHVRYGDVQALHGVSITVGSGEIVALLGANGAGKTTTLRAISGLVPVSSGTIVFHDEQISGWRAHRVVTAGLAHLPEGRELFPQLSVLDNLRMGYWSHRKDKSAFTSRVDEVMDHFPILRERSGQAAATLSGGEQQMLGVARALMSSPRLLLVDELSLGLAPKIVSQLYDILRDINKNLGTAVLLVEQFVHMALSNSSRAYVLAKGSVVMEGRSEDLASDPGLVATYLGGSADAVATAADMVAEGREGGIDVGVQAGTAEAGDAGPARARTRRRRNPPE